MGMILRRKRRTFRAIRRLITRCLREYPKTAWQIHKDTNLKYQVVLNHLKHLEKNGIVVLFDLYIYPTWCLAICFEEWHGKDVEGLEKFVKSRDFTYMEEKTRKRLREQLKHYKKIIRNNKKP